eukprot:3212339-Rhodomonas_salina.1
MLLLHILSPPWHCPHSSCPEAVGAVACAGVLLRMRMCESRGVVGCRVQCGRAEGGGGGRAGGDKLAVGCGGRAGGGA